MKLVNIAERKAKELAKITKLVEKFVAKAGCNTGDITWGEDWVQVENDGKLAGDIAYMIRLCNHSKVIRHEEVEGSYMWDANVYLRPYSFVQFAFTN